MSTNEIFNQMLFGLFFYMNFRFFVNLGGKKNRLHIV